MKWRNQDGRQENGSGCLNRIDDFLVPPMFNLVRYRKIANLEDPWMESPS